MQYIFHDTLFSIYRHSLNKMLADFWHSFLMLSDKVLSVFQSLVDQKNKGLIGGMSQILQFLYFLGVPKRGNLSAQCERAKKIAHCRC